MRTNTYLFYFALSILFLGCKNNNYSNKLDVNQFLNPPKTVHLHTWWHWIDGRITREGITKDLESMAEQGIVQATILNIGMSSGNIQDVKKVLFNSAEWHEMFKWALQESSRLGITIGVHNCDGWSESGGPWITPEMSMKKFVFSITKVQENEKTVKLKKPLCETNFYKDVAIIAIKKESYQKENNIYDIPKITMNDSLNGESLMDGNPESMLEILKNDHITISTSKPELKSKIALLQNFKGAFYFPEPKMIEYVIKASNDGKNYKKIADVATDKFYVTDVIEFPPTTAKFFKVEVSNIHDLRPWHHAALAELQLLNDEEQLLYNPSISYPLEKVASARILEINKLYSSNENLEPKSIISEDSVIDITDKMMADGTLEWNNHEGNWSVVRFGYTITGAKNGPATAEGTGLECDKLDTAAVNIHFKNFPEKLIKSAGEYTGNTFKFLMIDSWERGYQTWTQNMPEEFKKRRGYDMIKWLPVLCGETVESTELSEGFLYDFRKTIGELFEHNYYEHFNTLCHKNGLELHGEVIYGDKAPHPPIDVIEANKFMDMPMYEFWADINNQNLIEYIPTKNPILNFPVYSSNFYNKSAIGAEAYTGFAHFSESPSDLKSFGDRAYCSGINQLILHSYVHQPAEKAPGITLGRHGSAFNRLNPWWQYAKGWADYQARIQYVLQKGHISANILYYLGDQYPQFFENKTIDSIPDGYQWVPCNYDVLTKLTVKEGQLSFAKDQNYSILILPDYQTLGFSTLLHIERLLNEGAVIYGNKPSYMFSLSDKKENSEKFQAVTDKIWSGYKETSNGRNNYGKGTIIWGENIKDVIQELRLVPDFFTNSSDSLNHMFIHKHMDNTDIFFVFNQQDSSFSRECLFRTRGVPQIWDPLTGENKKIAIYSNEDNQVRIPVTFEPRQSLLFIFNDSKTSEHINQVLLENKQIFPSIDTNTNLPVPVVYYTANGSYAYLTQKNGNYTFTTDKGSSFNKNLKSPEIKEINEFTGRITFYPVNSGDTYSIEINNLKSFTDFQKTEIKYFSGVVKYDIDFIVPKEYLNNYNSILLSIGKLDAAAEIILNSNSLGNAWLSDNKLNVTDFIKETNHLEIELGTTCRNRIIGDIIEYGELRNIWTSASVGSLYNSESILKPSGITGPLQLIYYPD